jgi:type VI secretion system protein VasD
MPHLRRALLVAWFGLLGVACSTPRTALAPAEPTAVPLELEITAADRLNPDESGNSLVTAVVVYQLKSSAKLEAADFDQLYRNAKEALGADLLQSEELTLEPGQKLRRRIETDRAARAVAVVAQFRRPTGTSWRAVADLASAKGNLAFFLEGYRVERR